MTLDKDYEFEPTLPHFKSIFTRFFMTQEFICIGLGSYFYTVIYTIFTLMFSIDFLDKTEIPQLRFSNIEANVPVENSKRPCVFHSD